MAANDEVGDEEGREVASGVIYWPEITGLQVVVKHLQSDGNDKKEILALLSSEDALKHMKYRPKVKLHGSNAAVHLDGSYFFY